MRRRNREARSAAERTIWQLAETAGLQQNFTLGEVVSVVAKAYETARSVQEILVSPKEMANAAPLGSGFNYMGDYIDSIIKSARREVILLSPFWDLATLNSVFAALAGDARIAEIILLLVDAAPARRVETIVSSVNSLCAAQRFRVFVHRVAAGDRGRDYPHAKCLVVDRSAGYLGSANFTNAGLERRFELGVAIRGQQAVSLAHVLEVLWSTGSLFKLAWDSGGSLKRGGQN